MAYDTSTEQFTTFWQQLNDELGARIGKSVGFRTAQDAFLALGPDRAADAARVIIEAYVEDEDITVDFSAYYN